MARMHACCLHSFNSMNTWCTYEKGWKIALNLMIAYSTVCITALHTLMHILLAKVATLMISSRHWSPSSHVSVHGQHILWCSFILWCAFCDIPPTTLHPLVSSYISSEHLLVSLVRYTCTSCDIPTHHSHPLVSNYICTSSEHFLVFL